MNDDASGWVLLIAVAWLIGVFSAEPAMRPVSIEYAEDVCENNGGWKYIEEGYFWHSSVTCNNGAEFTYDWTELKESE